MFNLELEKVIEEIKKRNSKKVLLQLPDGLKTQAQEIVNNIEKNTNAEVFIWFGSCFGACDIPFGLNVLGIDLLVQFGHNRYNKTIEGW